eukprot:4622563-Pyramimonas_sp.AAC.1
MSVLLEAVGDKWATDCDHFTGKPYIIANDALYADDAMLVAEDEPAPQKHVATVAQIGKTL